MAEDAFNEISIRLTAVELGLGNHVSSCTEHRKREEDRHTTYNEKLMELIMRQNKTDENINAIKETLTEQRIRLASIVGLWSAIAAFLGNFAAAWLTR